MKINHDMVVQANKLPFSVFEAKYIPQEMLRYTAPNGDAYHINFRNTHDKANGLKLHDSSMASEDILDDELEACFDLIERTSASDYAASSLGWKPAGKRAEMREEDMRFLLLRRQEKTAKVTTSDPPEARVEHNTEKYIKRETILGFLSFMITIEEGQNVVYIYEIHLEKALRGCGLGRHLMSTAEHIGRAAGMSKAMLTVFECNVTARRMYEKVGYAVDECSPRSRRFRGGVIKKPEYYIMSKRLEHHTHVSGLQLEEGIRKKR